MIKLRNDDLLAYHSIAASMREFVEALLVRPTTYEYPCHFAACAKSPCGVVAAARAADGSLRLRVQDADRIVWGGDAGWV
eukprot:COSAG01_NODE_28399_length_661_cov_132.169039_1_plen_79_part_01